MSRSVARRGEAPLWRTVTRCLLLLATLCMALCLHGCDVPTHIYATWRAKPDYLVDFQFILPGEYKPYLNSCSINGVVEALQCNGHGRCVPWDSADVNSALFCKCDEEWADPECRTKRKSQLFAYMLSLVGGFFGIDQFYLGNVGAGIGKLCTFGGLGIWYLHDVVTIGTGNPYATVVRHSSYEDVQTVTTFRVAPDLPHWLFVTTIMVFFYTMGFIFAGLSASRYTRLKRAEFMLLNSIEHCNAGLTAMEHDQWIKTHYPNLSQKAKGGGKGKSKGASKGAGKGGFMPQYGAASLRGPAHV